MKFLTKWLQVPKSNEIKLIEAVQLWEVRWRSRHGEYSDDTSPELECFSSEEMAGEFATSLRQAFQLLRITSGTFVTVTKAK